MQQRLDRKPDAMTLRRATIEHVFGTLKHWMGSTHFLMKTMAHVGTEMSSRARLQPQAGDEHPGHRGNNKGNAAGGGLSLFCSALPA
jgi:hypothetical protein